MRRLGLLVALVALGCGGAVESSDSREQSTELVAPLGTCQDASECAAPSVGCYQAICSFRCDDDAGAAECAAIGGECTPGLASGLQRWCL